MEANLDRPILITNLIECDEILTTLQNNAAFSHTKSGYLQLIKNERKRKYFLQFFAKLTYRPDSKPQLELPVPESNNPKLIEIKPNLIWLKYPIGVVKLKFKEEKCFEQLRENVLKCIEDIDCVNESLELNSNNNNTKKTPKLSHFEIKEKKPEFKERPMKLDSILLNSQNPLNNLLAEYEEKTVSLKSVLKPVTPNSTTSLNSPSLTHSLATSNLQTNATSKTLNLQQLEKQQQPQKAKDSSLQSSFSINSPKFFYSSHSNQNNKHVKILEDINRLSPSVSNTANKNANSKPEPIEYETQIVTSAYSSHSSIVISKLVSKKPSVSAALTPNNPLKRRRENTVENLNAENRSRSILATTPERRIGINASKYDSSIENQENVDASSPLKKSTQHTTNDSKKPETDGKKSKLCGKGFSNLGNTCYMNAILQCILNIDVFSSELLSNYELIKFAFNIPTLRNENRSKIEANFADENCGNKLELSSEESERKDKLEESLYACLCELLKARNNTLNESLQVHLQELKNVLSKECARFEGYEQNDAHEFMCHFLDQLKDDFEKCSKALNQNKHFLLNDDKLVLKSLNLDSKSEIVLTNPIVDNFQSIVRHSVECRSCSNRITKDEEYYNLCLELPKNKVKIAQESLQNALNTFFKDEVLTDFKCEKCNQVKEVVIQRKFVKLPRVLILYLKRYQFQEVKSSFLAENLSDEEKSDENKAKKHVFSYKLVKNDTPVKIDKNLAIKRLLVQNEDAEQLKLPKKINKEIMRKYSGLKLDEILPQSVQKTPLKPTNLNSENLPFAKRETRSSRSSPLASIRNVSSTPCSNKKMALSRLDENTTSPSNSQSLRMASKRNIQKSFRTNDAILKSVQDEEDEYALPDLETDIQNPFESQKSKAESKHNYNPNDFVPNQMSDDDQMRRAIQNSLSETAIHRNEIMYVDGPFDDSETNASQEKHNSNNNLTKKSFLDSIFRNGSSKKKIKKRFLLKL